MENMENMDQKSIYYLEKAPVTKAIMHMVLPMMLSFIATLIYNITDAFFIGKLENTEMMAAVTIALPFSVLLMAFGHLFGVGAGTYVSRLLGESKINKTKIVCAVNFWSSIITGVIVMALCLPLLSVLLQLVGARGDALPYTRDYVLMFMIGAPFVIANISLEEMVRAEGASTASFVGMLSGVIANMILDPIFIFSLHLDIMGAALASVIGNAISVVWYMYYLQKRSSVQSITINNFKPSKELYQNIFKIGTSAFLLDSFMVITCLLFNNYATIYGNSVVAGFGISQRLVQIADFISMSFSMGAVPLIAFAYAAKKKDRLMEIIQKTTFFMVSITLILSVFLFIWRFQIVGIFSIDAKVIAIGQTILVAQLCSTIFAGLSALFTSMFQAFGVGMQSTMMSVIRGLIFIPILILGNILFAVQGVIWAMTISEAFTCIVGLVLWLGIRKKDLSF
ncbi:MAG: putative efflux protein family [Herbinix sp.]|jgi:putative MATE family efflux protein|nr:putative efflux protein family [Herbinix sp.]